MKHRGKIDRLEDALRGGGFSGDVETDSALRAAMATDNSVYQIVPDLIVAPRHAGDVVALLKVLEDPAFEDVALTARGGGTGTNGQSLNRGMVVDFRRYMNRLLAVDVDEQWAEVEPGMVLDDLNDKLRPHGLFFAPETSTSTRCTIGGMVSTDASGKGSRVYGKTSDNMGGLEIARAEGLVASFEGTPGWAQPFLDRAEAAARAGRSAFVANTPKLNRRFTGYDLERACPDNGGFEWWRLFLGAEGTLGPITRIRLKLRRIEAEKRLIVVGFESFRHALCAAAPLMQDEPTAIEVMDERVQRLAQDAGILSRLPETLRPKKGRAVAYTFLEFNGDDPILLERRLDTCRSRLATLSGAGAVHIATDRAEIRELWSIRSAGVGLLGKVEGRARPVAFVEDCVVPPENLPAFVDEFLEILTANELNFGIYGHVDVGCLHIRPALDIDVDADREKLVAVSDAVFTLTRKYGGIFWGEHGKGVRGAYLAEWIGPEAYSALQGVKSAFDPKGRFNPGKLVSVNAPVMGLATTDFRPFNAPEGDPLEKAFRCNGNAQCLSYQASTPMCPSFKATADLRHSPKGRADALRAWKTAKEKGGQGVDEADLLSALDTCLACKACASTCPVQVDIPQMRSVFYDDYYRRHRRSLADRLTLLAERLSPLQMKMAGLLRPFWPALRPIAGALMQAVDLPAQIAGVQPRLEQVRIADLGNPLPPGTVLVWQDWFTALFDGAVQRDVAAGLRALGYRPMFVEMLPAGKAALNLGDMAGFRAMATKLAAALEGAVGSAVPMIGIDPAFVMMLRQDYAKAGIRVPEVLLPQEFLAREIGAGRVFPKVSSIAETVTLLSHCTETTAQVSAAAQWKAVFAALGTQLSTPATGCCGMAGLFGHQKRHQKISRTLFDLSWVQHLRADASIVATGFSCRCQVKRVAQREVRHPLGLIADLFQ